MTKIIASKQLVEILKQQAAEKVEFIEKQLGVKPCLKILMAGANPASVSYVTKKVELARDCGMDSEVVRLDESKFLEYDRLSTECNMSTEVNGFMLQLPFPEKLAEMNDTLEHGFNIETSKDVDCLEEVTYSKMLENDESAFLPCTPLGILRYLKHLNVNIEGTHFAIVGRSRLVGKPMADLLLAGGGTVTIAHSRTANLGKAIENADVIISAVGRANLLNNDNVKPHHILVDVGINKVDGKLCGDASKDINCNILTPVPGGVGPLTVMSLITNTIDACYMQNGLARPKWSVK